MRSPCPKCGYATRYKQWPTRCACSDAERRKVRASIPPHVVEIWAEQEELHAKAPKPIGSALKLAPRYAAGRPRR